MANRKQLDPDDGPRAAFGERLRRLREERGWTQEDLAYRTGYSPSHISGVETGARNPTAKFTASADKALGTGEALARQGAAARDSAILEGFPEYLALEMTAAKVRAFELGIVPGLLQTPEYAQAITSGAVRRGAITEVQAEERLSLLARRQAAMEREQPPLLYFVLDESCLRRPVGGSGVTREQLAHLAQFASRPNVVLQIAPYSLAEMRAYDLPVNLVTLSDGTRVAYAESAHQGRMERESRFVGPLFTAYHHLQVESLSQADSMAMINQAGKDIP
ncbi:MULTISPECIES: helix-turn-helix transcriptional regulator [unclassified Streptomyces]|uniref:helix-turn-helix domain-containing protein n=1 Tax=unclassified Streptomyces TaxID=2593676 RepID=UPI0009398EE1|nr:helix-turn-helix transcriptional regulator [Streptomyces sp. TSRI0281]OKI48292.1 transcriptional regulator [Streptomyces sp. TSRI0281]